MIVVVPLGLDSFGGLVVLEFGVLAVILEVAVFGASWTSSTSHRKNTPNAEPVHARQFGKVKIPSPRTPCLR
eukprot:869572-Amphidinium_carterae.1